MLDNNEKKVFVDLVERYYSDDLSVASNESDLKKINKFLDKVDLTNSDVKNWLIEYAIDLASRSYAPQKIYAAALSKKIGYDRDFEINTLKQVIDQGLPEHYRDFAEWILKKNYSN